MDRQLRRPAREAQRTRPVAYPGGRTNARGADTWPPRGPDPRMAAAQELVGVMFSTAKELRHIAEQHFDELFVPTETVDESAYRAVVALRTATLGTLLVHAERERHWYPFRATRVELARPELRPGKGRSESPRPRLPYDHRIPARPRIDWL